jgi:PEGA domain
MRARTSLSVWIVAAVALASAGLTAQRPPQAKPVAPEAVRKAEQEIDKAAAARGINLTEAAKHALAKEAVHQEATAPARETGPVTGALSADKLSTLLTPLGDAPQDKKLDVRDVETRVIDNKTKQVVATLPGDIKAHERASGKVVPDEVRPKLLEDLTKQSDALSKSGLAVDSIRQRNEETLKAIDRAIGTSPITTQSYRMAMADIFARHVLLSILSTPDGASVSVNGTSIGTTRITDKQVKPATYAFKFQLAGYADAEREYYVAPGLESDSFTQVLTALSVPGSPPTASPSSEPNPPNKQPSTARSYAIPFGYIIMAGIIVVLLVALVARRR